MRIKPILFWVFLLVVDQLSKYFFYDQNLLSNLYFIHPSFNVWISRSLPVHLYLVIAISVFVAIILILLLKRNKISWIVFSFLIAWTLGNLIDRIALWWVRDFINIQIFNFPIFNIADVLLNIWIILLIIQQIALEKKTNKNKNHSVNI